MSQPACPTCGRPGAATPCPHCATAGPPTGSTLGITPPPPGVPPLPRSRGADGAVRTLLPRLPGYEVLELLGARGRASVYKARQTKLRRVVALALLHDFASGTDAKNGFRHEAQTLTRLGHPNLAKILDVGESESGFYFAMEYCPGGSLARKLEQATLSPQAAAELVEKVARAVQAAHERGVVHGRIGPSEVLLTLEGEPKLAGFGQAWLFGEESACLGEDIRDLGRLLKRCCKEPSPALVTVGQRCEAGAFGSARDLADALQVAREGGWTPPVPRQRFAKLARDIRRLRVALVAAFAVLFVLLIGVAALHRKARRASLPIDLSRAEVWVSAPDGKRMSRASEVWLGRYSHVARVEACLCGPAVWRGGSALPCQVLSGDLEGVPLGPTGLLSHALRMKLKDVGTVVVCEADLGRLGVSPDLQGQATVGEKPVRVVGVVGYPPSPSGPLVFCSAETARALLRVDGDEVTYLLAECDDASHAADVVTAIRNEHDDVVAHRREEVSRSWRVRRLLGDPGALVWVGMALAALGVSALILGRGLRSPSWPLALAVPLLTAVAAVAAVRVLVWATWPSCADVLRSALLDSIALVAALFVAALALALRPRSR